MIDEKLTEQIKEAVKKRIKPYKAASNTASSIGHPCPRYLYYNRTVPPGEKKPVNENLQLIFEDGDLHEKSVIKNLEDAGYQVRETQSLYEWKEYNIRGMIDGKIRIDGKWIPFDAKSINPYDYDKLNSVEDFLNSGKVWLERIPAQLLAYCMMTNQEEARIILKAKSAVKSFPIKAIIVKLYDHLEYFEGILGKLEYVNRCIEEDMEPERMQYNKKTCSMCDFNPICAPGMNRQEIDLDFDTEETRKLVEEYYNTHVYAASAKKIKEQLKEVFEEVEESQEFLVGDFIVHVNVFQRGGKNVRRVSVQAL